MDNNLNKLVHDLSDLTSRLDERLKHIQQSQEQLTLRLTQFLDGWDELKTRVVKLELHQEGWHEKFKIATHWGCLIAVAYLLFKMGIQMP